MHVLMAFWASHFPILSILLPAVTAVLLVLLGNVGADATAQKWRLTVAQGISLVSALLGLGLAVLMLKFCLSDQIRHYELSEWSAPFGIVLVVDRLSAMMLLLSYSLLLPILWYASAYWDQRGRYFHAMCHFLMMGLSGAFLTGDLFNLFVFFEILLIASYVLLLHGQGKNRFHLGIHYVVINLLASSFFLIGLGLIYANVGSLNMADVARLLPTLAPAQQHLALAGGMLLLLVFCIKAAVFPVGFWLPKTYAVAATPVAAIFALMTKVGIYALLRVNGTVFSNDLGQHIVELLLLPIGIITSVYGVIAAIGAERLRRMIGFMITSSIGTMLIGISLFNQHAWAATLFYMLHSSLIAAGFYLYAEWISGQRGAFKDHLKISPVVKQPRLLAMLYLLMAMVIVGFPPFSGFIGKLLLLQATLYHPQQIWIILVLLLVSLLSILAFVRNGFVLFWRATPAEDDPQAAGYAEYQALPAKPEPRIDHSLYFILGLLLLYMLCAEPIYRYCYASAEQLMDKQRYQDLILKKDSQQQVISVQDYDANYIPHSKSKAELEDRNQPLIPFIIAERSLNPQQMQSTQQAASTAQAQHHEAKPASADQPLPKD